MSTLTWFPTGLVCVALAQICLSGCGDTAKFGNGAVRPSKAGVAAPPGPPGVESPGGPPGGAESDVGSKAQRGDSDALENTSETSSSTRPSDAATTRPAGGGLVDPLAGATGAGATAEPGGVSSTPAGSKDPSATPATAPSTAQGVVDACSQGHRKTLHYTLTFPRTDLLPEADPGSGLGICKWASSPWLPSGERGSDVIRGVHSQKVSVSLPAGAVVCASGLSTAESTKWRYDDEVVLLLNGVVLLASQDRYLWRDPVNRKDPLHSALGNGFLFDWNTLAKERLDNEGSTADSLYCYGHARSAGLAGGCELPLTQQVGRVTLDLATASVADLSLRALQEKALTYELLVTGDNDPEIDCRHDGIVIDGTLEYVVP